MLSSKVADPKNLITSKKHERLLLNTRMKSVMSMLKMLILFPKVSLCFYFPSVQYGRPGFDPWVEKTPGEGRGYPLQYSGLENSMDCIVHGVSNSWIRQSDFHSYFHTWPSSFRLTAAPVLWTN